METLKDFFTPPVIWFLIGLAMVLAEFILPGVIIIFFGIGAWVVALLCVIFTGMSLNMMLLIFIISSLILLISLRRYVRDIFLGKVEGGLASGENLDDLIGRKVIVLEEIKAGMNGKVEFNGTSWEAEADQDIPAGVRAVITGKESIILKVKPL